MSRQVPPRIGGEWWAGPAKASIAATCNGASGGQARRRRASPLRATGRVVGRPGEGEHRRYVQRGEWWAGPAKASIAATCNGASGGQARRRRASPLRATGRVAGRPGEGEHRRYVQRGEWRAGPAKASIAATCNG